MEVETAPGNLIISALGKPLFLGDIYYESTNTFTNQGVLNMWLDLFPGSQKHDTLNQWNQSYFFRQAEPFKWLHLDIPQHNFLSSSAVSESPFWFSDYINHSPPSGWVHITIHFSFHECKISVTDVQHLLTMSNSLAMPTAHVVSEVLYGANSLLMLDEPIGIGETKESAEDRLFLAAKCLAEGSQHFIGLSDSTKCRFYSDLADEKPITGNLTECFSKVEEILSKMECYRFCSPVKATLTPLLIKVTCLPPTCLDNALYLSTIIQNLISISLNDLFRLLEDPLVQRTNRMHPYLMHFRSCLNQLSIFNNEIMAIDDPYRKMRYKHVFRLWQNFFAKGSLTEWLIQRKRGLVILNSLMEPINLPFLSNVEIPDLVAGQTRKIFMLKTVKRKDPFLEQFHLEFGQPESLEFSMLDIVSSSKDHIERVRSKLAEFSAEIDVGSSVQRFVSTSFDHEDAQIVNETMDLFVENDLYIRGTRLLKIGNPSTYLLQPEKRIDEDQFRWFQFGSDSCKSFHHRTLILMGVSDSGKSTLVDSIVNYILNVQWPDPFRFRVDPDIFDKQRKLVTAYTIYHVDGMSIPYSLTIIDTPGFNGNVDADIQSTHLIASFLTHKNSRKLFGTIDAICLVANSTQKIGTSAQGNVIEAIKFLFLGCDYTEKVHWYCTFASNPKKLPSVLETIPLNVFPTELHYEFENSFLFVPKRDKNENETEEDYSLGQFFWDKAWDNHRSFFSQLK